MAAVRLWGLFSWLLACCTLATGQARLEAFEKAQQAREHLRAGVVEFTWERAGDRHGPTLYTAQIAENGDTLANLGRGEVGHFYDSDGNIVRRGPHLFLHTSDARWSYDSDGISADEFRADQRGEHAWNLRSLGLNLFNSYMDPRDTLSRGQDSACSYTETVENGLAVVRAATDRGTITWYFDPQRDWNPVHVAKEHAGKIVQETRITLNNYDGVWFPATVEFFGADYFQMEKPYEVVSVTAASFNRPDQPRILTPAAIGIESGMNIQVYMPGDKVELMRFDGEKSVSMKEFGERVWAGEIKYGPTFLRSVAALEAAAARSELEGAPEAGKVAADPTSARRRRESAWEAYTREFIARYHLDDGQSQKAWSILRECQEEANQYLVRHKSDFEQLQQKLKKVADAGTATAKELWARSQQAAKLRAPLNEIFERQLKPRLDKLPTRAQRAAAERDQPPASQP
jgi:hypothetical protein